MLESVLKPSACGQGLSWIQFKNQNEFLKWTRKENLEISSAKPKLCRNISKILHSCGSDLFQNIRRTNFRLGSINNMTLIFVKYWKPGKTKGVWLRSLKISTVKTLFSAIFRCRLPNFFPRGWGGVLPLLGAERPQKWVTARRRRAVYDKFRTFENFWKIVA